MQIGGSDQYRNITARIPAIEYIFTHHPNPVARAIALSTKRALEKSFSPADSWNPH
jgi:hypothetical protein